VARAGSGQFVNVASTAAHPIGQLSTVWRSASSR
jgi:hypothetical protein